MCVATTFNVWRTKSNCVCVCDIVGTLWFVVRFLSSDWVGGAISGGDVNWYLLDTSEQ